MCDGDWCRCLLLHEEKEELDLPKTGYIKNPAGFWLIMIIAVITCGLVSFYHWDLIVMGLYTRYLSVGVYTILYASVLFAAFPVGFWIFGKKLSKQFSRAVRVKHVVKKGEGTLKNAVRASFGLKPKESTKIMIRRNRPSDMHFYRFLYIVVMLTILVGMFTFQYLILSRCIHWSSNSSFLGLLLWDISFSGGNAAMISILSFLGYKTKTSKIPPNYAPI